MGLFDKKYCDVCGEKIGFLGNKKLEDANLCKSCAGKLSPFFTGRRHSTLAEIQAHLAYREENLTYFDAFRASRTFGNRTKIYLDDENETFFVSANPSREENPDILCLSQVLSCETEISERETEELQPGPEGKNVPFCPPRYHYDYTFRIVIQVDSPWFSEIRFELAQFTTKQRAQQSIEYYNAECRAVEIHNALMPAYPREMPERPKEQQVVVVNQVHNVFTPPVRPRPGAPAPARPRPPRPQGGPVPPHRPPAGMYRPAPPQGPVPPFGRPGPDGGPKGGNGSGGRGNGRP